MNRITRIAALALTFAAAGSAMAESIDAGGRLPQTPFSSAPLAMVKGATHDFDFVQPALQVTKTRAEVQAELRAAIADGSLHTHGEDYAVAVRPASTTKVAAQTLAAAR
ncbi:MAG: DUF4148 domain-containing protein [Rubrivivax sp.]